MGGIFGFFKDALEVSQKFVDELTDKNSQARKALAILAESEQTMTKFQETAKLKDLNCEDPVALAKGLLFWAQLNKDEASVQANKPKFDVVYALLKSNEFSLDKVPQIDWALTCNSLKREGGIAFDYLSKDKAAGTAADSWENTPLHEFNPQYCESDNC